MQDRAYSVLEIKALNEDERLLEGWATTPSTDRMGDVVEPMGAKFAAELPLLWQHRHDEPVGTVRFGKPTEKGIPFTARIAKIEDDGDLKSLVDKAWQSVKAKLVRAVSIGFRAIEYSLMEGGGVRFLETEIYELSLVTVPANADCTITTIRSIDTELRAASGQSQEVRLRASPGASGKSAVGKVSIASNRSKPEEAKMSKKTVADQISAFETARAEKSARMDEIMTKAAEAGETLDGEQTEEYDGLEAEVKSIDAHLERLKRLESVQAKAATPVTGGSQAEGSQSRQPSTVQVKAEPKLEAGIGFARIAKVKALAKLDGESVRTVAKELYGENSSTYGFFAKTAVPAGNTGNNGWAGNLVGDETSVFADFVEYLRPQTILGRFGANGVPGLRRVPFDTPLIGQSSGGQGYWVGEGKAKPLTKFDFTRTTLGPLKVANIAVVTEEVLRRSSPSAEGILRDQLAAALRERLDIDFIDPTKAAASGVSPASITNGVVAIPSEGSSADDVRADIKAVFAAFIAANNAPTSGVWIMKATTALALSLMQNPLGQSEFPGIAMTGGTLFGLPVIVSEYVPEDTAGAYVALVNASDIYFADEGGIAVDMSREASLEMDDAPSHDSTTPTETTLVSMFQTNSVAFRCERVLNWAKRRTSAVALLSGVNWGAA